MLAQWHLTLALPHMSAPCCRLGQELAISQLQGCGSCHVQPCTCTNTCPLRPPTEGRGDLLLRCRLNLTPVALAGLLRLTPRSSAKGTPPPPQHAHALHCKSTTLHPRQSTTSFS
jgi:hypothetical protein